MALCKHTLTLFTTLNFRLLLTIKSRWDVYSHTMYANIQMVDALCQKLLVNIFEFIVFRLSKVHIILFGCVRFCSVHISKFGLDWFGLFAFVWACVSILAHQKQQDTSATWHLTTIMFNPRIRHANSNKLSFVLMFSESHICFAESMEICLNSFSLCMLCHTFDGRCSSNSNVYIECGIIYIVY